MKITKEILLGWSFASLFTMLSGLGFSQTAEPPTPVDLFKKYVSVPPSADAAALGKFGNVPVSLFTGQPNVDIPLYTVRGKEITLPISLSHSTGGFKVAERSSWAGLGWVVNAGGVISRSVIGLPDLDNFYGQASVINDFLVNFAQKSEYDRQTFFKKISTGEYETQPDIYHYNFNGYSGSFEFNLYGEAIITKYEPLKILANSEGGVASGAITSIEIVAPDGTIYNFEDSDETTIYYDQIETKYVFGFARFNSAFYLSSMISPNKLDTIRFHYIETAAGLTPVDNLKTEYMFYEGRYNIDDGIPGCTVAAPSNDCVSIGVAYASASTSEQIKKKFLSEIVYRDTRITFNSVADRHDAEISGDRRLDNIEIVERGKRLKKIKFNQTYFGSAFDQSERLKLNSIQESYFNDTQQDYTSTNPPYQFYYNSLALPSFNSRSIDHWGYFNGSANSSLIPTVRLPGSSCNRGMSADREAHEQFVKACTLEKIVYPTGGETDFTFELHQAGQIPYVGSRIDTTYAIKSSILHLGGPSADNQSGNFSIASATTLLLNVSYSTSNEVTLGGEPGPNRSAWVELRNFSNNDLIQRWDLIVEPNGQGGSVSFPLGVPAGDYTLIVHNTFYNTADGHSSVLSLSAEAQTRLISTNQVVYSTSDRAVGGLRIKSITDVPVDGTLVTRSYTYDADPSQFDPDGDGQFTTYFFSSGILYVEPRYDKTSSFIFHAPQNQATGPGGSNDGVTCSSQSNKIYLYANSQTGLGSFAGSHIGYSKVIEHSFGGTVNHYFNNASSTISGFDATAESYSPDITIGDIAFEDTYDGASLLKRAQYGYEVTNINSFTTTNIVSPSTADNKNVLALTNREPGTMNGWEYLTSADYLDFQLQGGVSLQTIFGVQRFSPIPYFVKSQWKTPSSTRVTDYSYRSGQQNARETLTTHVYGDPAHGQLTSQTTVNSDNRTVIVTNRYPNDKNAVTDLSSESSAAMDKMLDDHRVNELIEKVTTVNGMITEAEKTDYKVNGNIVLPTSQWIAKLSQPSSSLTAAYELRSSYVFDGQGNLTEFKKDKNFKKAMIWSKDNLDLIAQVDNAASSDVAYTSFESGSMEGNWSYALSQVADSRTGEYAHNLGTSSVSKSGLNASILYVITFWAKNGVPSVSNVTSSNDDPTPDANGWKFYMKTVSAPGGSVVVSGSGYIDDLKIFPAGAQMTSYTYRRGVGVTAKTDPNNISSFMEYDEFGRLIVVRDAQRNIVKTYKYHYKN